MPVPKEYEGREQSYLKHEVLKHYLSRWGPKLASIGRSRRVKLWYVDCFAGPWEAQSTTLADTSIAIGLTELKAAATSWANAHVEIGALFVEPDRDAFSRLNDYLRLHSSTIDVQAFNGEFGGHVDEIDRRIGNDPAFLFVDPTGWKGAAMKFIAPLARRNLRDVLVNVMTNDIQRFHHDPRPFLRAQMQDFFGLNSDKVIEKLDEEGLIEFNRDRLKQVCDLAFAADLAVPHPTHNRTKFRLVVGGHDKEVLRVFREAEEHVIGGMANEIRDDAMRRKRERTSGNLEMAFGPATEEDRRYEAARSRGEHVAADSILAAVRNGPVRFDALWPPILERQHLTVAALGDVVGNLRGQGRINVNGWGHRQKKPKDEQIIRASDGPTRP